MLLTVKKVINCSIIMMLSYLTCSRNCYKKLSTLWWFGLSFQSIFFGCENNLIIMLLWLEKYNALDLQGVSKFDVINSDVYVPEVKVCQKAYINMHPETVSV